MNSAGVGISRTAGELQLPSHHVAASSRPTREITDGARSRARQARPGSYLVQLPYTVSTMAMVWSYEPTRLPRPPSTGGRMLRSSTSMSPP